MTNLPGRAGGNAPCLLKDPETGEFRNLGPSGDGCYDDSAIAADIAGDGKVVSLYGGRDGVHHAMRQDGTEAPGWPKLLTPAGDSGMAVGNLSGDTLQVVSNADGGRIYVFDEPAPATTPIHWPMFLANNLRNGMPGHPGTPQRDHRDSPSRRKSAATPQGALGGRLGCGDHHLSGRFGGC